MDSIHEDPSMSAGVMAIFFLYFASQLLGSQPGRQSHQLAVPTAAGQGSVEEFLSVFPSVTQHVPPSCRPEIWQVMCSWGTRPE